jgi:hypothetical protein
MTECSCAAFSWKLGEKCEVVQLFVDSDWRSV